MTNTTCPATTDGTHDIDWITVPAMQWQGGFHAGYDSHERGICYDCDERFIREANHNN